MPESQRLGGDGHASGQLVQVGAMPPVASESSVWPHHRKQVPLNQHLQAHTQTILNLEAEKTELQSALPQNQQAEKQEAVNT